MLVLATLFWAGNFIVGKIAFIDSVPPFSLTFFRWLLVWLILIPFTYNELFKLQMDMIVSIKSHTIRLVSYFYCVLLLCYYNFNVIFYAK